MSYTLRPIEASSNQVAQLMVIYKGVTNEFGEDEGKVMAVDFKGRYAPIKFSSLLKSVGYDRSKLALAKDSILEKVTLLSNLEGLKRIPKSIFLSKDFENSLDTIPIENRVYVCQISSLPTDILHDGNHRLSKKRQLSLANREFTIFAISALGSAKELKLAYAFYDKLVSIFSYSSGGSAGALDKKDSYLQVIPNGIPLSIDTYKSKPPVSPGNPRGDLTTTEEFSALASMAFNLNGQLDSIKNVQNVYGTIINAANTTQEPDEKALQVLEKVRKYLFVTEKDPFTGDETEKESEAYRNYKKAMSDLRMAQATYIGTKNGYDLTNPADQQKWQVDSIMLQERINQAMDQTKLYPNVVRALEYLASYRRNAVQYTISTSQSIFNQSQRRSQADGTPYYPSYGFPYNWYDCENGFARVNVTTKDTESHETEESKSYGGGASYSNGLISVRGNFSSSDTETRHRIEASEITFDFEVGVIPIQRPWMNMTLFSLDEWTLGGETSPGTISHGVFPGDDPDLNKRTLPYYSTALVIAKNIKVSGNWSASDEKTLKTSLEVKADVSIGPFKIGGANYSKSSSAKDFVATYNDGTYTIPGAQIVGVINKVVPFSAPK